MLQMADLVCRLPLLLFSSSSSFAEEAELFIPSPRVDFTDCIPWCPLACSSVPCMACLPVAEFGVFIGFDLGIRILQR